MNTGAAIPVAVAEVQLQLQAGQFRPQLQQALQPLQHAGKMQLQVDTAAAQQKIQHFAHTSSRALKASSRAILEASAPGVALGALGAERWLKQGSADAKAFEYQLAKLHDAQARVGGVIMTTKFGGRDAGEWVSKFAENLNKMKPETIALWSKLLAVVVGVGVAFRTAGEALHLFSAFSRAGQAWSHMIGGHGPYSPVVQVIEGGGQGRGVNQAMSSAAYGSLAASSMVNSSGPSEARRARYSKVLVANHSAVAIQNSRTAPQWEELITYTGTHRIIHNMGRFDPEVVHGIGVNSVPLSRRNWYRNTFYPGVQSKFAGIASSNTRIGDWMSGASYHQGRGIDKAAEYAAQSIRNAGSKLSRSLTGIAAGWGTLVDKGKGVGRGIASEWGALTGMSKLGHVLGGFSLVAGARELGTLIRNEQTDGHSWVDNWLTSDIFSKEGRRGILGSFRGNAGEGAELSKEELVERRIQKFIMGPLFRRQQELKESAERHAERYGLQASGHEAFGELRSAQEYAEQYTSAQKQLPELSEHLAALDAEIARINDPNSFRTKILKEQRDESIKLGHGLYGSMSVAISGYQGLMEHARRVGSPELPDDASEADERYNATMRSKRVSEAWAAKETTIKGLQRETHRSVDELQRPGTLGNVGITELGGWANRQVQGSNERFFEYAKILQSGRDKMAEIQDKNSPENRRIQEAQAAQFEWQKEILEPTVTTAKAVTEMVKIMSAP